MPEQKTSMHTYRLETVSDSPFFGDQNLYLCIASYEEGADKPFDIAYLKADHPQPGTITSLETGKPAAHITIAIYTIPQQYPEKSGIAENQPFTLTYKVFRDNTLVEEKTCDVDRWGGLQIIGIPYK